MFTPVRLLELAKLHIAIVLLTLIWDTRHSTLTACRMHPEWHVRQEQLLYTLKHKANARIRFYPTTNERLSAPTDNRISCIGRRLSLLFSFSALLATLPCHPGFIAFSLAFCKCFAAVCLSDQFLRARLTYLVMIVVTGRAPSTG